MNSKPAMKSCPFCKATIRRKRIEHVHRWGGHLYLFKNVRAEVCSQCGETFLTEQHRSISLLNFLSIGPDLNLTSGSPSRRRCTELVAGKDFSRRMLLGGSKLWSTIAIKHSTGEVWAIQP